MSKLYYSSLKSHVKLPLSKLSISPQVKVKDEPVDEEYDEALVPYSTSGQVKDEPETVEVRCPLLRKVLGNQAGFKLLFYKLTVNDLYTYTVLFVVTRTI